MLIRNNVLKRSKSRRGNTKRQMRRLGVENMEDRKLMAADVALSAEGVIEIDGTNHADSAEVALVDDMVRVTVSSGVAPAKTHEFLQTDVEHIIFHGRDGNDRFANDTNIPSTAYGNRGRDTLIGGSRQDKLFGGLGKDTLEGRRGNDVVDGGPGNDSVYGNKGTDVVTGGSGTDKVNGGADADLYILQDGDEPIGLDAEDQPVHLAATDLWFISNDNPLAAKSSAPSVGIIRGVRDFDSSWLIWEGGLGDGGATGSLDGMEIWSISDEPEKDYDPDPWSLDTNAEPSTDFWSLNDNAEP